MAKGEKCRLFFAVEVPEDIRRAVYRVQEDLARGVRNVIKWVEPANLHLTLKFVGEVLEEQVVDVVAIGRRAAQVGAACEFAVAGAGAFPNAHRPRVIWLGTRGDLASLQAVATELDHLLAEEGLAEREDKPFTPHLTLGRVRRGKPAPDLTALLESHAGAEFGEVRADSFVLMRSYLRPAGPVYEVADRFGLPGGTSPRQGE
ncbi:MAG: RNA 2',3'-cyclic phosphodiesterase [Armatimonadota bacterium]